MTTFESTAHGTRQSCGADPAPAIESMTGEATSLTVSRLRGTVCRIMTLLNFAAAELDRSSSGARSSIDQAALILREEIGQPLRMTHLISEPGAASRSALPSWQARRVLDYVEEHLAEPIRVCDLSALVNLTEGYFSRAFKRRLGTSPHTYIVRRRVQRGARLMLEGGLPLSEVALRCGFSDQAHFNKSFRKLMGTTPAAWRRSNRDDSEGVMWEEASLRSAAAARHPESYYGAARAVAVGPHSVG